MANKNLSIEVTVLNHWIDKDSSYIIYKIGKKIYVSSRKIPEFDK